jgi:hypothetical protein
MIPRFLMITSALFLAACGLATLFAPEKVLGVHGTVPDTATVLLVQMMGALYLGFALLNWTVRNITVGGIHARPVAVANFLHFLVVTLLLGKAAVTHWVLPLAFSALVFGLFAAGFGALLFIKTASQVED